MDKNSREYVFQPLEILPTVALRGLTIFPGSITHFDVVRPKSVAALQYGMKNNSKVFLATQKDIRKEDPTVEDLYKIGTVCRVRQLLKLPGDNMRVMVEGLYRAGIEEFITDEPFLSTRVDKLPDTVNAHMKERTEAAARVLKDVWIEYVDVAPRVSDALSFMVETEENYDLLPDRIAQDIPMPYQERQKFLAERRPYKRLEMMASFLNREVGILTIQKEIQEKTQESINKNQKEYYIREQIHALQNELGEGEDTVSESERYKKAILELELAPEAEEKLLKEAGRLSRMGSNNPESSVIRNWLDAVLELPWRINTPERRDINAAEKLLDSRFYGMNKVKERILEFLAVRQKNPSLRGQVICLAGPPGTGKTSIGSCIAEALGRKFARVSLGGARDEADIRGHRKTYIGAMPGRIIHALQLAKSKNPVILLDEIDKMASDFRGDPASAMLEVLDGEQNHAFRDHYIELPFDLSDVLFIMTANEVGNIPRPLLDRMELIELTSYTDEEKAEIARRHLLPRELKKHGLRSVNLKIDDQALRMLIRGYTRESGVRNLEREIAAVCRKSAYRIVKGECKSVKLTEDNLESVLGPKRFTEDKSAGKPQVGVVTGLAWTAVGGEVLPVEVNILEGSGKLELTGNLGDVMKESAQAALSCIRSRAEKLQIDKEFYKKTDIHVHFPEGAVPKDGPSAGITMVTALVSALTGRAVPADLAMTGEVTIRGRVLAIGGLREKTMAAMRFGAKKVIIPQANLKDLDEIDPKVREALTFIAAEDVDTVLDHALLPAEKAEREVAYPTTAVPSGDNQCNQYQHLN